MKPDWSPFIVETGIKHGPRPLTHQSPEGIADRLRAAAFAEVQAEAAFLWAADHIPDAPEELRNHWRDLAVEERKHRNWLLTRLEELGFTIQERTVSDSLWHKLISCKTAAEFCFLIADAEERGRVAGARFSEKMRSYDPISADIFGKIAEEEVAHIALAKKYF